MTTVCVVCTNGGGKWSKATRGWVCVWSLTSSGILQADVPCSQKEKYFLFEMAFLCNLSGINHNEFHTTISQLKPCDWECKPAYLVLVTSQDKVGGLRLEWHLA